MPANKAPQEQVAAVATFTLGLAKADLERRQLQLQARCAPGRRQGEGPLM